MGGFNTPIEGSAEGVNSMISSGLYESLKNNDKLYLQFRKYNKEVNLSTDQYLSTNLNENKSKSINSNVFGPYREGELLFAPTSKIMTSSDNYNCTSSDKCPARAPGWTDRILWTSKQKE